MCTENARYTCSKCKKARYCSRDCQAEHWNDHKIECRDVSTTLNNTKSTSSINSDNFNGSSEIDKTTISAELSALADILNSFAEHPSDKERKTPIEGYPMRGRDDRQSYVSKYSYSIPTTEAIRGIISFCSSIKDDFTILSVCSGKAYWEYLISKEIKNTIICTDIEVERTAYCPVLQINSYQAVQKYKDVDILFISWPPMERYDVPDEVSHASSAALTSFVGKGVIYIGEPEGFSTGDKIFHKCLQERWKLISTIKIPQWRGIHDFVYLYTK